MEIKKHISIYNPKYFEIKILNSLIKLFLKKLLIKFIPDSRKILEKPNFLAFISAYFKSILPSCSFVILYVFTFNLFNEVIFFFIYFIIKNNCLIIYCIFKNFGF